ncbi:hypothetical protein N9552_00745, partial [bacterium]|nr:hypothetical protein [bacterium]
RLGYLRAILFKEDGKQWEPASRENVPESGEAFVHRDYKQSVDAKFRTDELLIANINELASPGSCVFGAVGVDVNNILPSDDLAAVFDFDGNLKNQEIFNIKSKLRPPLFSFLQTALDDQAVLVGPMKLITGTYNETESLWESRLGLVAESSRYYADLKPYSAYVIPISKLPENTILESDLYFNNDIKIAVGLMDFIKSESISQSSFITDSSLLKIMDGVLNKTTKLGRKGKREIVAQVEAAKQLNPEMKEAIVDLLSRMDSLEYENKTILRDAISTYSASIPTPRQTNENGDQELASQLQAYEDQIKLLEAEKRTANQELKILASENEKSKLTANIDDQRKIQELKELLSVYENSEAESKKIEELQKDKDNVEFQIQQLKETEQGLSDTVSRLNSDLALNTGQFRDKALAVLPFFEIMNNVKPKRDSAVQYTPASEETLIVPESVQDLVGLLSDRIIEQGYQADSDWLQLVSALYLSNKFIGFFGDPGTGKTTLANCFRHAFGEEKASSEFIKVGRGWSSFVDFIGYDNSFTGEFKYKNIHFKRFETREHINNSFQSLLFDEATLSSPEFYLSDFSTYGDIFHTSDLEEINLDGHSLYVQKDLRLILTFNVDETTEQLSDRFISRMPIIHLTSTKDFSVGSTLRFKKYSAINKTKADELLSEAQEGSELTELLVDEFYSRRTVWKDLLPGEISQRKTIQIEKFHNISRTIENLDPSLIIDFVEEVFLLPQIKGDGLEFKEALEKTIPEIKSPKAKRRLAKIKSEGQKYNVFRHI